MIFLLVSISTNPFEVSETVDDFALPLNEVDPRVPRVVVDEGDEISAPAKTNILCRPPYIGMYLVELIPAPVTLVGERKLVLLPELVGFTNLRLPDTKFGTCSRSEVEGSRTIGRIRNILLD